MGSVPQQSRLLIILALLCCTFIFVMLIESCRDCRTRCRCCWWCAWPTTSCSVPRRCTRCDTLSIVLGAPLPAMAAGLHRSCSAAAALLAAIYGDIRGDGCFGSNSWAAPAECPHPTALQRCFVLEWVLAVRVRGVVLADHAGAAAGAARPRLQRAYQRHGARLPPGRRRGPGARRFSSPLCACNCRCAPHDMSP
jgi:hypothetical protein